MRVMLAGITSLLESCKPALSSRTTAWGAGRHGVRDLGEVQGHGFARAAGQDQTGALALIRVGTPLTTI